MFSMLFVCLQAIPAIHMISGMSQYSQFQDLRKRQKHIYKFFARYSISNLSFYTSKKYRSFIMYVIFSRFECCCENDGSIYSESRSAESQYSIEWGAAT